MTVLDYVTPESKVDDTFPSFAPSIHGALDTLGDAESNQRHKTRWTFLAIVGFVAAVVTSGVLHNVIGFLSLWGVGSLLATVGLMCGSVIGWTQRVACMTAVRTAQQALYETLQRYITDHYDMSVQFGVQTPDYPTERKFWVEYDRINNRFIPKYTLPFDERVNS